jgi:hypothetical protein
MDHPREKLPNFLTRSDIVPIFYLLVSSEGFEKGVIAIALFLFVTAWSFLVGSIPIAWFGGISAPLKLLLFIL